VINQKGKFVNDLLHVVSSINLLMHHANIIENISRHPVGNRQGKMSHYYGNTTTIVLYAK
jgi:hypothetical protein